MSYDEGLGYTEGLGYDDRFDFDEITPRANTNSLKYDFARERGKPDGVLPLWVADMDFKSPPAVLEAMRRTAEHGIFGYSMPREPYYKALATWFDTRFGYHISPEKVVVTPGVVFAIATAIRAFTKPGDGVLIQRPVYYPFSQMIIMNDRKLVNNPLVLQDGSGSGAFDSGGSGTSCGGAPGGGSGASCGSGSGALGGRYEIDFDDFERKIVSENVKLFIFCSPHNPVGRVWSRRELEKIGEICLKHNCLILSDEVHCDFVFPGNSHQVFAGLSEELADITISCTAPSKTFNLAGLQISNIIIANPKLRVKYIKELHSAGYSEYNIFGLSACRSAYEFGGAWVDSLVRYLNGNLDFLRAYLTEKIPSVKLIEPEGTYLTWLDFRGTGIPAAKLDDFIINKANLWLDGGTMFGEEGAGFQRINIACPRAALTDALDRLAGGFAQ
ncbi:MAG: pyridoxal phosphate-dependent aminotransferase [Clostridiales Family XIII bacterium]|jgi:cystathionine beta-lyase|nr:pyridoxal phosphate-dependent aminotransferase [Clostridiales Family XIII bacterium]